MWINIAAIMYGYKILDAFDNGPDWPSNTGVMGLEAKFLKQSEPNLQQ